MTTNNLTCSNCHSSKVIKYGQIQSKQRFYCKNCKKQFLLNTCKNRMSEMQLRHALQLYLEGCSFREISSILKISHVSIYKQIEKYKNKLKNMRNPITVEKLNTTRLIKILAFKENIKNYPFLLIDMETGLSYKT